MLRNGVSFKDAVSSNLAVFHCWFRRPYRYNKRFVEALRITQDLLQGGPDNADTMMLFECIPTLVKSLGYAKMDTQVHVQEEIAFTLELFTAHKSGFGCQVLLTEPDFLSSVTLCLLEGTPNAQQSCANCIRNITLSPDYRPEIILQARGIREGFVKSLLFPTSPHSKYCTVFALAAILKQTSSLDVRETLAFVRPLKKVLARSVVDEEIDLQLCICHSFHNLAQGNNDSRRAALLDSDVRNILESLLEVHLSNPHLRSLQVTLQILKIFGTLGQGSEKQCQLLIKAGFFHSAKVVLEGSYDWKIVRETHWVCSNMVASLGPASAIAISKQLPLEDITQMAAHERMKVKVEALWTLVNIALHPELVHALANPDIIHCLGSNLLIKNTDLQFMRWSTFSPTLRTLPTSGSMTSWAKELSGLENSKLFTSILLVA